MKFGSLCSAAAGAFLMIGCDGSQVSFHAPNVHISANGSDLEFSGKFPRIQVDGPVASETREVKPFQGIRADGIIEVKYSKGDKPSIIVTARKSLLSHIDTTVQDGVLRMEMQGNVTNPGQILVTIVNPQLDSVEASGSSQISCEGLSEAKMDIRSSGAATVTLDGSVGAAKIDVSGSAGLSARNLGKAEISGTLDGAGKADLAGLLTDVSLSLSGSSEAHLKGVDAKLCSFELDGGSHVDAQGRTEALSVSASGSGSADLAGLTSRTCTVKSGGGSEVKVSATAALSAVASGGSNVTYKGKPSSLSTSADGGAQIHPQD